VTIFDVGAHDGSYTALAMEIFGDRARIYDFEPSPMTFANLRSHIGERPGIVLNNFGLGDQEGEATLSSSGYGSPASSMYTPSEALFGAPVVTEKCLIRSLDQFCDEEQVRRIDLLKIDVEGNELNVLRGAARALEAGMVPLIQFEFGEAQVSSRTFFKDIYDTLKPGYRIYRILRAGLAPIDSYDESREVFRTTNYLAVSRSLLNDGRRSWW
jgi:FkbM family methyltransferase